MKTKHTRGKWFERQVPGDQRRFTVLTDFGSSTQSICHLYHRKGETEANAKLIAAAPDLLEALDELRISVGNNSEFNRFIDDAYKKAVEAIKKATS